MNIDNKLDKLHDALVECTRYYKESLPLCAAENVISAFAKVPLIGFLEKNHLDLAVTGTVNFLKKSRPAGLCASWIRLLC